MKPEYHVDYIEEGCYTSNVEEAQKMETHIECQVSKEDIGNLLQGKAINLLFLDDGYELAGMIDIKLSDDKTSFNVSDKLNNLIIGAKVDNWIPCTPYDIENELGRLPSLDDCKSRDYSTDEKFGSFLVTSVCGKYLHDRYVTQACYRIGRDKSFWYRDGTDMQERDNIVAWQPLPEAYKGKLVGFKLD